MLGDIFERLGENTRMAREEEAKKQDEAVNQRVSLLKSLAGQLDPNSPTHAQDIAQLMEWAEHPFGDAKPKGKQQKGPGGSDPKEYRGHLAQVLAGLNKFAHQFGHGAKLVGEHIGPFYQAAKTPAPLDTAAIQRMVGSAEDRSKWDTEAQQREVQAKLSTAKLIASNLQLKEGTEEYSNFVAQYVTGKGLPKADVIKLNPNQIATDAEGNKIAEGKPTPPKTPSKVDDQLAAYSKSINKPVSQFTPEDRLKARSIKVVVGKGVGPGNSLPEVAASGSTISDTSADNLARAYISTAGKIKPSFGMSKNDPNRIKFWNSVGKIISSDPEWINTWTNFSAGTANLNQLTKIKGVLGGLEGTFKLDINNAREASKAVDRTNIARYNKADQFFTANFTDYPELAKFRVAILAAANQYAQVMNAGAAGASRVTVNAQDHAKEIVNTFVSDGTIEATLDQMVKEADNKVTATDEQIERQKRALSGNGGNSGTAKGGGKGAFQIKVNGKLYTYKGSGSTKDLANYTESK